VPWPHDPKVESIRVKQFPLVWTLLKEPEGMSRYVMLRRITNPDGVYATGIEICSGEYNWREGTLHLRGEELIDPKNMIGKGLYKMELGPPPYGGMRAQAEGAVFGQVPRQLHFLPKANVVSGLIARLDPSAPFPIEAGKDGGVEYRYKGKEWTLGDGHWKPTSDYWYEEAIRLDDTYA
jgi:hypothetical protein